MVWQRTHHAARRRQKTSRIIQFCTVQYSHADRPLYSYIWNNRRSPLPSPIIMIYCSCSGHSIRSHTYLYYEYYGYYCCIMQLHFILLQNVIQFRRIRLPATATAIIYMYYIYIGHPATARCLWPEAAQLPVLIFVFQLFSASFVLRCIVSSLGLNGFPSHRHHRRRAIPRAHRTHLFRGPDARHNHFGLLQINIRQINIIQIYACINIIYI